MGRTRNPHALAKAKDRDRLAALMTAKAAWLNAQTTASRPGKRRRGEVRRPPRRRPAASDAAIHTHGGNAEQPSTAGASVGNHPAFLAHRPRSALIWVLKLVAQHSLGLPRSY